MAQHPLIQARINAFNNTQSALISLRLKVFTQAIMPDSLKVAFSPERMHYIENSRRLA
ncbi:hypothetical protein DEO72_LG7g1168 [Vigna unguiculata]|uniref:Uncharacterized protein n=1 Tax=Vigna unguiculata TaxID=3917 RepID=A0A4D6MH71_VIGUN|nr:hypothetical protein DEO72_LG7g1168 [Vigna unguiculata]